MDESTITHLLKTSGSRKLFGFSLSTSIISFSADQQSSCCWNTRRGWWFGWFGAVEVFLVVVCFGLVGLVLGGGVFLGGCVLFVWVFLSFGGGSCCCFIWTLCQKWICKRDSWSFTEKHYEHMQDILGKCSTKEQMGKKVLLHVGHLQASVSLLFY